MIVILSLALLLPGAVTSAYEPVTTLAIDGTAFTINGQRKFLLGCSYYAALSASDAWIRQDLADLRKAGFNWVRIWATWRTHDDNVSVVDENGELREPWIGRLRSLVEFADSHGMLVDITLDRAYWHDNFRGHLNAARALSAVLKPYRNIYFDLGNERNIRDARHVPMEEVAQLRAAVKHVDPRRIVTASHAGDISDDEIREYLEVAGVDFLSPHRPRHPASPSETEQKTQHYLQVVRNLGRPMPIHFQEPFRRNFNQKTFQPGVEDFLADALGALRGGAAGWCLHIGDNREAPDGRPRKVFDMSSTEGRLFDQIDEVEREVISRVARHLGFK